MVCDLVISCLITIVFIVYFADFCSMFQRPGAFAIYLEPWHADIFQFLDCRKNTGSEEHRARDLFLGLWIPDLFMRRVENDETWTLMCPHECPGLFEVWGEKFEALYEQLVFSSLCLPHTKFCF